MNFLSTENCTDVDVDMERLFFFFIFSYGYLKWKELGGTAMKQWHIPLKALTGLKQMKNEKYIQEKKLSDENDRRKKYEF